MPVKALIDTPAGQRPLRTVVGTVMTAGVDSLNRAYDEHKKRFLAVHRNVTQPAPGREQDFRLENNRSATSA